MVISDNGPHGAGAHYGHVGSHLPHSVRFFDSNGPLRGKKRSVHEGGIRIPMIVRVPPSVRTADSPAPGTVIRTPVAVWDLLPTFADLAGGRTPRRIDGISFAPTLRGGGSAGTTTSTGSPAASGSARRSASGSGRRSATTAAGSSSTGSAATPASGTTSPAAIPRSPGGLPD